MVSGLFFHPGVIHGGGVTLITHGFNGNVTDWIIPMAQRIPLYGTFPGTNYSCYEISITQNGQGQFVASQSLLAGVAPTNSDSGEIIIKLDWSSLSSGAVPTTTIATVAANALLATNFIPALGERTLSELPLHLVGHSRGSSVITEMARLLGAQGLWVDQVTTLDPRPVSQFGDPAIKNYANVFFADNYWQNMGDGLFVPNGQSVPGAYNRYLTNLSGGYNSSHSDVHLWYHGTLQLTTPASDTQAPITSSERQLWWTTLEEAGTNAGFKYSLIAGGNRFSTLEPSGAGNGMIVDGINKVWNLGAGTGNNRTRLNVNNGLWPNLLRILPATNRVIAGSSIPASVYYQYGTNTLVNAALEFFLDPDANPYDGNELKIYSASATGTGTNSVGVTNVNVATSATTPPGTYYLFGRISDGTHPRYLYAGSRITIQPGAQPPVLAGAHVVSNQFAFTVNAAAGQRVAIEISSNLTQWSGLQTNTMAGSSMDVFDSLGPAGSYRFYRAVLVP